MGMDYMDLADLMGLHLTREDKIAAGTLKYNSGMGMAEAQELLLRKKCKAKFLQLSNAINQTDNQTLLVENLKEQLKRQTEKNDNLHQTINWQGELTGYIQKRGQRLDHKEPKTPNTPQRTQTQKLKPKKDTTMRYFFRTLRQFFINVNEIRTLLTTINRNILALARIELAKTSTGDKAKEIHTIIVNTMQE